MSDKRQKKIIKYRPHSGLNIGTLLFGILFVYMLVCVILYLTSTHVTPYVVTEGTLSDVNQYTALALKSEVIVNAPQSGHVVYYAREGSEVAVNGSVCSVSENDTYAAADSGEGAAESWSSDDTKELRSVMAEAAMNYSGLDFQKVNESKADIESKLLDLMQDNQSGSVSYPSGGLFNLCSTDQPGIVVYSVDQFENIQPEEVTQDMFDEKNYTKDNLRLNETVTSGEPLYKLIVSETWNLIIPIDGELATELSGQERIRIRFLKDNTTATANVSVFQNDNTYFANLELGNSVVRFATDRFLEVELLLTKKSGLKIPKSAVAERSFYVIPEEYVVYDEENEHEINLIKETYSNDGTSRVQNVTTTVYEKVDNLFYVDVSEFSEGDYILRRDSSKRYRIEETATLQGVYNINKGYAVFREVTVLSDNEEYCIVEEGTTYGLAQYDRIALDASTVTDEQII